MRSRLQLLRLTQPTALHSVLRAPSPYSIPFNLRLQRRTITADEKPLPKADQSGPGPNQDQLPHVSEEAATTGRITGEGGPDLEQGTPVQEILQRDKDSQEKAPKVIQEEWKSSPTKGSRSFSTSTRRLEEALVASDEYPVEDPGHLFNLPTPVASDENPIKSPGHLFDLPALPLPSNLHLKYRYDPVIKQMTGLIMQDGKLARAQRHMSVILQCLRTSPTPVINPNQPLIEGSPPASHLPLNPILYLQITIDSVAPLLRFRSQKGAAGGGTALQIPVPIGIKQRRRQAMMWILDAVSKRKSEGSGRGMFARKVAKEIIAIAEGRSAVWDRRTAIHKMAIGARANLKFRGRK